MHDRDTALDQAIHEIAAILGDALVRLLLPDPANRQVDFPETESSPAAFALVLVERLHPAFSNIGKSAVERLERGRIQREPVSIGGVAQVFQPVPRQVHLVLGQLIDELV